MTVRRLGAFFGEDWEDAFDSIKSVPGAFGNILIAAIRQFRLVDGLAFLVVLLGWAWLVFGAILGGDHRLGLLLLSMLPTALWLAAGATGAVIFEVGGIGPRVLSYWESYVLILAYSLLGLVSLRLALNPRDRHIVRPQPPTTSDTSS